MPLYERIALYSIADVAVVTATRDGMNLVPYEYIVCRQGADVSPTILVNTARGAALGRNPFIFAPCAHPLSCLQVWMRRLLIWELQDTQQFASALAARHD